MGALPMTTLNDYIGDVPLLEIEMCAIKAPCSRKCMCQYAQLTFKT